MCEAGGKDTSAAAARQTQEHAEAGVDAPHCCAFEHQPNSRQVLRQRCVDERALDAEKDGLGGWVHKQDARPQSLSGAVAALPVGRRQFLQALCISIRVLVLKILQPESCDVRRCL